MTRYIGAIDQGTTSTRFIVFDRAGDTIATAQMEHRQIYPQPGWVEHDPLEIWRNTQTVIAEALRGAGLTARDLAAVGITNQRETTLLWDRATGQPVHNAMVWQDTRVDPLVAEYRARWRPGPVPRADRPAAGQLFLRPEAALAAGQRARCAPASAKPASCSSARSIAGWSGNFGRAAPHRRHQRQPHAADEPGDAGLG